MTTDVIYDLSFKCMYVRIYMYIHMYASGSCLFNLSSGSFALLDVSTGIMHVVCTIFLLFIRFIFESTEQLSILEEYIYVSISRWYNSSFSGASSNKTHYLSLGAFLKAIFVKKCLYDKSVIYLSTYLDGVELVAITPYLSAHTLQQGNVYDAHERLVHILNHHHPFQIQHL
ncbi:hypothetical protein ACJX0J_029465 [Zea mays]